MAPSDDYRLVSREELEEGRLAPGRRASFVLLRHRERTAQTDHSVAGGDRAVPDPKGG